MAALGCDIPRQTNEVRASFIQIVGNNMARLAGLLPAGRKRESEDHVLSTMATMIGAMILGCAVDDSALSDRILSASRKRLIQQK
jgi:TetR/AcrR family transcriptional regulator, transcriptional repressor for nem operon